MPDLSMVEEATRTIGARLQPNQLVVLESTTYPGTTEEVVLPILEAESGLTGGTDFLLAFSPERIDPGNEKWAIRNTPKIVGGIDPASTKRAVSLYEHICDVVVPVSGTREAEMTKLLENTYRHVNIALVNEMAVFCDELGIDIWEVIAAAATKPFGFEAFFPVRALAGTASRSIPTTSRSGSVSSATNSGSSSWRRRSTSACHATWWIGSPPCSMRQGSR